MNGHNGVTAKLENQRLVELKNEVKMKIIFNIEPVEQARPRATRMGRGIRLYDPKKVSVYKKQLAMMCKFQYKEQSLSGQLIVSLKFYRHIQKSLSKKNVNYGSQERTDRLLSLIRIITLNQLWTA